MRILPLLLILLPCVAAAQINRSATELACERVKEYVETKLFKDLPYKSIDYGQLKASSDPRSSVAWSIRHQFEIETPVYSDKKSTVLKKYSFSFYLDKKLKVLKAESYMLE